VLSHSDNNEKLGRRLFDNEVVAEYEDRRTTRASKTSYLKIPSQRNGIKTD
jgi:hypothetical protein